MKNRVAFLFFFLNKYFCLLLFFSVSFNISAPTTGWIGLGISPTGGMTNAGKARTQTCHCIVFSRSFFVQYNFFIISSFKIVSFLTDIAMGWVDDEGRGHLQDRFATGNGMPILDASQVNINFSILLFFFY